MNDEPFTGPDAPFAPSRQPRDILPWLLMAVVVYVLSFGPMDWLVEHDCLPPTVLYYQRPLRALANEIPALDHFLHWYVAGVWGVFEPATR